MLTLGCKMQRTCNLSCQPGVATDGHLFNGDQINTERYFVNLAASIQLHLKELGYNSLHELRGRTDLLTLIDPDALERYDFSPLLDRSNVPASLNQDELNVLHAKLAQKLARPKEDILIAEIYRTLTQNRTAVFNSEPIVLNTQDRSFGGRTVGVVAHYLQEHRDNKVILNTTGTAGQSYGFVNHSGMILKHTGTVQDGCGKSMTGGELILCTPKQDNYLPHQNTIAGNAMIYGASGGRIYVNGRAGHRFGILMKGAEAVVEGVGDFAFEYMTSGTGMILGSAGAGLATGASGGIIFAYDPDNSLRASNSVTVSPAGTPYSLAIQSMLKEHWSKTNSDIAQHILTQFQLAHFKILIPVEMDKINSLRELLDVIETFKLRKAPITRGMQVWLEQKIIKALLAATPDSEELNAFRQALGAEALALFSHSGKAAIRPLLKKRFRQEDFDIPLSSLRHEVNARSGTENNIIIWKPKVSRPVQERLATISGGLDHIFIDAIEHIQSYVTELSHNAEGCSGCRAQSCAGGSEKLDSGCPSGKGINTINALLKYIGSIDKNKGLSSTQWKYLRQAFEVQIQESPFIAYTGAACPAPCQDACTETIPGAGPANLKRGGKLTGEYVHIKDIEYYLYQVGRSLGWFDGKKHWTDQEIKTVFGSESSSYQFTKTAYDEVMSDFKPSFSVPEQLNTINKEVIIIGSGPAAMQIAYRALRDGIRVRMYERSNKPGGLLVDGIPAHKFDKIYLTEDFTRLQAMGLELYLNSDVYYDERTGEYRIHGDQHNTVVASRHNEDQYIALCIGTGIPKSLDPEIISDPNIDHKKIVQAVDFLKRANDIADELKKNSSMSAEEKEALIWQHLAHMDPRNKKIVVIGGGDTAQDVIRWTARYFNELLGELNILIRGGPVTKRAVLDAYPAPSRAPSYENELKKEEIEYIHGTELFLVEPKKIKADLLTGKLNLTIKESHFKYAEEIQQNPQLAKLFEELPRELKPLEKGKSRVISAVDLIISALGFQGNQEHSLVKYIQKQGLKNIYIAGDAAGTGIIVEAQNNANKIYGLIRKAMGIHDTKPYSTFSFFVKSKPSAQAEENESSLGLN
jgi:glutamate synthase domain-containing protein 3/NADPH-dependent glutamate synthase beta subunit-like oxidoreductase